MSADAKLPRVSFLLLYIISMLYIHVVAILSLVLVRETK